MNHYVYKVIERETKQFYIGSRSCKCLPKEDINYLGSMCVWKPNKTKLEKIIIKQKFKNREDAIIYEIKQIIKYIENPLNENYSIPGKSFHTTGMFVATNGIKKCIMSVNDSRFINGEFYALSKGMLTVKDMYNNTLQVSIKDPRYLSGELKPFFTNKVTLKDKNGKIYHFIKNDPNYSHLKLTGITKGKLVVKDKNDKQYWISIDDPKYLSGELVHISTGFVNVYDEFNNILKISINDPKYLSGEYLHICTGNMPAKDKNGNIFYIKTNDPKYLSGELVGNRKYILHTQETKDKISKSSKGEKNGFYGRKHTEETLKKINETKLKNKLEGKTKSWIWICNVILQKNMKIVKNSLIPKGWKLGRLKISKIKI